MNIFLIGLALLFLASNTTTFGAGPNPAHAVPSILSEKWTASDKPYMQVISEINEQYARKQSFATLVQQYKALARLHPADPLAKFSLICAEYGEFKTENPEADVPISFAEQMEQADPGNVHQFARYRLIFGLKANRKMPLSQVVSIGNRLLEYNPKDDRVRKTLVDYLVDRDEGIQNALRYAKEGVKVKPNSAQAHASLALAYQTRWASNRKANKAYAPLAVAEYESYLRFATINDPFRKDAQYLIGVIRKQAKL